MNKIEYRMSPGIQLSKKKPLIARPTAPCTGCRLSRDVHDSLDGAQKVLAMFTRHDVPVQLALDGDADVGFRLRIDRSLVQQLAQYRRNDRGVEREHVEMFGKECVVGIGEVTVDTGVIAQRFVVFAEATIHDPRETLREWLVSIVRTPTPELVVGVEPLVTPERRFLVA